MAKFTASELRELFDKGISDDLIDKIMTEPEPAAPPAPEPPKPDNPAPKPQEQPEKHETPASILSGMLR